jgi:sporulation protein YlmC with PRC-barrel domain
MTTAPLVPMIKETVREGISPEMKVLTSQTAVNNEGTTIGKLQAVQIENSDHRISSIVVRHGLLFTEVESIPAHEIDHFSEEVVALKSPANIPPVFAQKH